MKKNICLLVFFIANDLLYSTVDSQFSFFTFDISRVLDDSMLHVL